MSYERKKDRQGLLRSSLAIVAVSLLLFLPSRDAQAEELGVSVEVLPGYTRLIFEGREPIGADAEILNSVLLLDFDRPVEFDLNIIRQEARRDVSRVRQDADGKMLRFALNRGLRLQKTSNGNRLAIDLVSSRLATMPEAIGPQDNSLFAAEQARLDTLAETDLADGPIEIRPLPISISRMDDFSRVVFEWPERIDYNAELKNSTVNIVFDQAADPSLTELRTDPPKFIKSAEKSVVGNTLQVDLRVETGAGVRHFREGPTIVVDVLKPAPHQFSDDAEPNIVAGFDNDWAITELEATEDTAGEGEQTSDLMAGTGDLESTVNAAIEAASVEPDPTVPTDANPGTGDQGPAQTNPLVRVLKPSDIEESQIVDGVLKAAAVELGDTLKLVFNWGESVPSAVFRRGPNLWLVFDHNEVDLDLSALNRAHRAYVSDVQVESQGSARIARLTLPGNNLTTASERDGVWIITLGPAVEQATVPFDFKRAQDRQGQPMVLVPFETANAVHWITDPLIGDDLAVVTGLGPIRGIISTLSLVEFNVLSSAHGLVVQALSDDVVVDLGDGLVQIGRNDGLTLSQVRDLGKLVEQTPLGALTEPAFMDFDNWRNGEMSDVYDIERELQFELVKSDLKNDEDQSKNIRLGLAKFYVSHELAPEALGALRVLAQRDETAEFNPVFRALRGVANYMQRRYTESYNDFALGALAADPHAALWRASALTELSRFQEAHRFFEEGAVVLPRYTPEWQAHFRVQAAKAALGILDVERVKQNLDALPVSALPDQTLAESELVRGRWLEEIERMGEALQHYQRVLQFGTPSQQAQAQLGKISLLHSVGQISDEEAINRLDTLRFQWRGDDLELAVLHRLGQLYVEDGNYRQGLNIMQEVVANYSDSPVAGDIAISMEKIFKGLFLDETIEDIPPVQALALYYDYKHLTPIGREGDEMIRKLVDRLVAVDLLEQAAELLEHQTNERLKGVARAQVATRLAMVYLTDRKAEAALQTIRKTRQTRLPTPLTYARRLLEARALAELGRFDHALEVVAEFDTPEIEQLRADIAWDSQDWANAASILELNLGERWQDESNMLTPEERNSILRAALAYSFAEDPISLERIRRAYGPLMAQTPDASSFEVITQKVELRGVGFRELANEIATVDTLESFMSSFQERLDLAGETAIN